jgi:S-(hydroxymethyl)glutathione dehydrogenase/alcohol dehydrogenase
MVMKIKAAVCREYNTPITIEEVELAPPKEKEVLVKTRFTGFCHSDWSAVAGWLGFPLPLVLGHEAAGIVVDVGPGVTSVEKGDHIVAIWAVSCGTCKQCVSGRENICSTTRDFIGMGTLLDGTSRLTDAKGKKLCHQTFVSGFAEYMVIPEQGAVKMRKDFPLDQACFISCCMPTGFGAVYNAAQVKPGNSVAVWGMGGIGLNVVHGAKLRGADPIIAVDLEGSKESIAREFGATHFINSSKEDPVPKVQELTGGGADFVFEAAGETGAIAQAYWAMGIGGKQIQIGIHSIHDTVPLSLSFTPPHNRDIIGTLYGGVHTHQDLPKLADMVMNGSYIDLNKLISKKFRLEQINDAFEAMTKRQIIGRWVCEFD